jgi:hypothetical protein
MENLTGEQPAPRERIGSRAWVRTVGLVGGGLVAGGILAGTLTANAATDESTTTTPSVTQEEGTTGTTTPEDCPEGAGPRGGTSTAPDGSTTPDDGTTPDDSTTPGSSTPSDAA